MASPDTLRVAAAQYPLDAVQSLSDWQAKTARWVGDGAATGAQLIVFPEYGLIEIAHASGAAVAGDLQATLASVADAADAVEATFAGLARQHGVAILAPSGPRRRADGRFVNSASLVLPSGAIGRQDKLIMTPFERDWGIVPGPVPLVFETALGRIGIAICYDSEFPLLVRAMVEGGAELVLIPACTERLSGHHRVRTGALARALEGGIATVMSSTIGEALWSPAVDRNTGAAGVFVPPEPTLGETGVIAEGRINQPGWIAGEIDFAALRRLGAIGEMRNAADWASQPGARHYALKATRVDLI